jgi:pyruvate,water dikinase
MRVSKLSALTALLEVDSALLAGAKAFHLAQLARAGIVVPETFVLPVGSDFMPNDEVLEALGGCIAVRSSATAEDSQNASFAGQFESILNVRTREELARAIHQVRASVGSEAVRGYCAGRGIGWCLLYARPRERLRARHADRGLPRAGG